jgi:tripartite-type tricarboxylate transporter receptor subunit TctC
LEEDEIMSSSQSLRLAVPLFAIAAAIVSGGAAAQSPANFPWKPVTLIMPYTPGSTSDIEARVYQDNVPEFLKQNILIDYKPGASGMLANSAVIKAPPDGHTIAYVPATLGILPAVRNDIPYDWQKDLMPVIQTTRRVFIMAVRKDFPANTYQEYVAYAKANPGKVTWSTVGAGGALHMSGEWLAAGNNIKLTFVHYKGSSQAELDMLASRIDSAPKAMVSSMPLLKQERIRVLAIITGKRTHLLPDVKTVEEMGIPGYNYPSWVGIVTGANVPRETVDKLYNAFAQGIRTPKAMKVWDSQGTDVVALNSQEFRKQLLTETALWTKLVKENNIKYDAD